MKNYISARVFFLIVPILGVAADLSTIQPLSEPSGSASAVKNVNLQPHAVYEMFDYVFPELIIGGEWTSTIRITNRSSATIPYTNVYFVDNNGNPMITTFQTSFGNVVTDQGFAFTLGPGGTIEGTFFGGSATQFGYAFIDICHNPNACLKGLYGEVTLTDKNATRPDFQSIFPLETPAPVQYMMFDHRNGFQTMLYLVNNNTATTVVKAAFLDPNNNLIDSVTVALPPMGSQIINLNAMVPKTIGLQGILQITGTTTDPNGPFITATSLQINPSNSFTPKRAFVPKL